MNDYFLSQNEITELQNILLDWFRDNSRNFPWRKSSNPFHILIAEKLLQQTFVGDKVVNAYLLIVTKYPNPKTLSNARIEELHQIVAPLGLNYRAQEMINLASAIDSQFSGNLPDEYKSLMKLPGVGEYIARAVLSFGYNQNIAIVDTNVARVLFRVFGIGLPIPANPARKKYLIDLATSLIPEGKSREFNFAILDFSAKICKPKNPACQICPISRFCFYFMKSGFDNKPTREMLCNSK